MLLNLFKKKPEPMTIAQAIQEESERRHQEASEYRTFNGFIDGYVNWDNNLSSVNDPIKSLGLSTRGENVLKAANVKTIRELLIYTRYELLQLKHCGKTTADEIEFQLEERYKVKLRPVTFR